ncbi:hypothetical protein P7B02_18000 [Caulobacter segnis]|uniref:hypothetical protein n=1 Tax=Caulobacter segnis TaxID=88688 RepID=UPI00240ED559|nr:hypothetical protein [Caulobacter segnis]MDG2523425.1 hypothetical protein [Caulobacter segnis]
MAVRGSYSGMAMTRLAANAFNHPEAISSAELRALAEYHAHLSRRERAVLLNITRRLVEIERREGAEAVERRLREVCAVMGPSGNA